MAYDLITLITSIRKLAKDESFDTGLITDFIQTTQNEVLNRSRFPFMEVTDSALLAADDTDYQLDDEVDVILALSLVDDDTDQVLTPEYVGYPEFYERYDPETATATTPSYYTIFGNTLVWCAPLDGDYTLKVKYLRTPSILALDSDVPDIPERFKDILIRGALSRIEETRDNFDLAAIHQRKVEEVSEDMLNRLSLRQLIAPHKARFGRR
jgi:hypothetical protein